MRSFSLPLTAILASGLLLSACSKQESSESAAPAAETAADANGGPAIPGAIAPGVAFNYNYAFTLPAKAISGVQQQHAAACQKLGADRCRVTGMHYDQPREGDVRAEMDFLLAPDIAHAFGTDAIGVVEKAEGKLENASVDGSNAGEAIRLSQQDSAAIDAEVARIEGRLAAKGLSDAERVELRQQIVTLREQQRGQAQDRKSKEAMIASTSVSFSYTSEGVLAGKGTFGKAASASWSSAESMLALLTFVVGVALPWVLLIGGAVLIWRSPDLRRLLRRLFGIRSPEPASGEQA